METTITIKKETRKRLNILKQQSEINNLDLLINHLIDTVEKKKELQNE